MVLPPVAAMCSTNVLGSHCCVTCSNSNLGSCEFKVPRENATDIGGYIKCSSLKLESEEQLKT